MVAPFVGKQSVFSVKQLGNHMTSNIHDIEANIGDRQTLICLKLIPHCWAFKQNLKYDSFPTIKHLFPLRVEVSFKDPTYRNFLNFAKIVSYHDYQKLKI